MEMSSAKNETVISDHTESTFPNHKILDRFDFSAHPSINESRVLELLRCECIEKQEALMLTRNPETGKTHLAAALTLEACARGKRFVCGK